MQLVAFGTEESSDEVAVSKFARSFPVECVLDILVIAGALVTRVVSRLAAFSVFNTADQVVLVGSVQPTKKISAWAGDKVVATETMRKDISGRSMLHKKLRYRML